MLLLDAIISQCWTCWFLVEHGNIPVLDVLVVEGHWAVVPEYNGWGGCVDLCELLIDSIHCKCFYLEVLHDFWIKILTENMKCTAQICIPGYYYQFSTLLEA